MLFIFPQTALLAADHSAFTASHTCLHHSPPHTPTASIDLAVARTHAQLHPCPPSIAPSLVLTLGPTTLYLHSPLLAHPSAVAIATAFIVARTSAFNVPGTRKLAP